MAAVGAVGVATPFVASWHPSAKQRLARLLKSTCQKSCRVNKSSEWRGKPVFILRRTPEMLESLKAINSEVADPNSEQPQQPAYAANEARAINAEIAVLVGICTHLGCSPQFRPEVGAQIWVMIGGGYFCPCHGSV